MRRKRGRPRKSNSAKLCCQIKIWIDSNTAKKVKLRAKEMRKSLSVYVREILETL